MKLIAAGGKLTGEPIDMAVIVVYLVAIVAIGLWAARKQAGTSSGYFLAGRSLRWPTIGLAMFATNISTVHLVGLASSGYGDGLVWGNFELLSGFPLILLGLVFAPFYFRSKVSTLPEYIEKRYGPDSRTFLAFMAVLGALFIHIGVSLYAGAVIFESFFDIPIWASILAISVLTSLYTVAGGLKAVVVTEAIQTFLLLAGAIMITVMGMSALSEAGVDSISQFRERLKPGQFSMVHTDGGLAWYGFVLGYPVLSIWYWCTDQTIVQRTLGAKTQNDAQLGAIFAGFLKVFPLLVMVIPGAMAYVLFRDKITDPDETLAVLISELVPVGFRGLIAAGLLAALMSTIAGALNSISTLVSIDIVKRIRPETPDHKLIRIGRITACVAMLLATLWSTKGGQFGGIFKGLNQMIACLAPPITAVFVWGVLWPRGTRPGAFWTLVCGFLLGAVVFYIDFPAFGHEVITKQLEIPFLMQAWWMFCICSVLLVTISLATPKPSPQQIDNLCWPNPLAAILEQGKLHLLDVRVLAVVLVVTMLTVCYLFA